MKQFFNRSSGAVFCAAALAVLLAGGPAAAQEHSGEETAGSILVVDEAVTSAGLQDGQPPRPLPAEGLRRLLPKSVPDTTPSDPGSRPRNLNTSETIVLATWDGGTFTNQDLSATLQWRRPPGAGMHSAEQVLQMPPERLRAIVRDLVYELALYRKAQKEGVTAASPEIAEKLNRHRDTVLNRLVYQRLALPLLLDYEEKAAREYYEKNKEKLYTVPGVLTIRNLHVPTYVPYTVQEGDTLVSIAEKISGDAGAVTSILRDDPLHYPRVPLTGARGPVPILKLQPGEKLLVPVAADGITSAESVARQIRERLAAGASFEEVREQFPQAMAAYDGQPFVPETEGMFPEIHKAISAPDATTVSEVIRTPWGFDVIQIADRQPSRTLTFEEVEEKVFVVVGRDADRQKKDADEVRRDLVDRLGKKHGLKIDEQVLRRPTYGGADPLTGSTPIATAPDFTYTLDEYLRDMRPTEKSWAAMSFEERLNLVRTAPAVLRYLFGREAVAEGLDKLPAFQEEMKSKEIQEVVGEYLRRTQEHLNQPTEAQLREYYQQHLDRYTSAPRVTLREISKRVNFNTVDEKKEENIAKAKKELAAIRARIQTRADFEQAARRESHSLSTRSRGGLIGTVASDFRGESFENQINQLKPGEVSEPFLYGSEVMIIRLDERQPSTVVPFEDAVTQVRRDYLNEVPRKLREQQRDELLKEVNYEPKI